MRRRRSLTFYFVSKLNLDDVGIVVLSELIKASEIGLWKSARFLNWRRVFVEFLVHMDRVSVAFLFRVVRFHRRALTD